MTSVQENTENLDEITETVEILLTARKAEKERRMEKSRQNREEIHALLDKVEDIAQQSGFELSPADDEETTKAAFFVPNRYR